VAPAAAAPTEAQIEALEAWLDPEGKQKLSLPLTALIPRKVNGQETRVPFSQVLKEHQFQADYERNNTRVREQRAALELRERKAELDQAAWEAKEAVLQGEIDRFKAAQGDPEAMERLAADQDRLRNDPEYRKLHEDALAHRMSQATAERDTQLTQYQEAQTVADDGAAYINRVAAQYPGVDPKDIQTHFSLLITSGQMEVGPGEGQFNARTVDQVFQREADKLKAATAPVLAELEGLRKRLEAMEAKASNQKVVTALRSGASATSVPASPRSPAPPMASEETLSDRAARWARQR
jgi:hypothetical protein